MGSCFGGDEVAAQTFDDEQIDVRPIADSRRSAGQCLFYIFFFFRFFHGACWSEKHIFRLDEGKSPGERLDKRAVGIRMDHFGGGKVP